MGHDVHSLPGRDGGGARFLTYDAGRPGSRRDGVVMQPWQLSSRSVRVKKARSCALLHSASLAFSTECSDMEIGIIGSGKMGAGLGRLWAKHGHHVMFNYPRRPEKLGAVAQEIGSHAQWGTPRDVVRFADVVLLAVPWSGIGDALSDAGSLDGRTLISCVNPFGPGGLEVGLTSSAAEEISKLVPGAAVVEAFNTIFASILYSSADLFGDKPPTVFY